MQVTGTRGWTYTAPAAVTLWLALAVAVPAAGCPDGDFVVSAPASLLDPVRVETVRVRDGLVAISSGCPPIAPLRLRTSPRGTRLRVVWPACLGGEVRLTARVAAPGCDTMHGRLRRRGVRPRAF